MAKTYGLMRLGRDAELRTVGDQKVVNLSLAYNYGKKDGDSGRPTQWLDGALWGKRAESLAPYLKKGSLHLFTVDDVHMEKYTDKDGFEAFKLAGTVADVELGPNTGTSEGASSGGQSAGQRRPASGAPSKPTQPDLDDDIPF